MELVFLGTSGSIPTAQRGLPSIALKLDGGILLLDCAEGTQRQMSLAHLSPMKIDSIFITHLHGDHFLGLAGLVQALSRRQIYRGGCTGSHVKLVQQVQQALAAEPLTPGQLLWDAHATARPRWPRRRLRRGPPDGTT